MASERRSASGRLIVPAMTVNSALVTGAKKRVLIPDERPMTICFIRPKRAVLPMTMGSSKRLSGAEHLPVVMRGSSDCKCFPTLSSVSIRSERSMM